MTIYYLCPSTGIPSGGIKQIYRHVDILNKNGFDAAVFHDRAGFRCTWFKNKTRIVYSLAKKKQKRADFLVVPEGYGPGLARISRGGKTVIFNQNAHYTFTGYSQNALREKAAYQDKSVVAVLCVSDHNYAYLKHCFPKLNLHRIHHGIDSATFDYSAQKKKLIAFMPRKLPRDILQVINILKYRAALKDFAFVSIDGQSELAAARVMKQSLIFLSFNSEEGFGLPPAEAMACGCVVIGYHGFGGKEYFQPKFSYPIETGDILGFAKTIERVIEEYGRDRSSFLAKGKLASREILKRYSTEREASEIIRFWATLAKMTSPGNARAR